MPNYKEISQITDYQVLTQLPDVRTDKTGKLNDLTGYLPNLFNLAIGLAAVLAVGYIIWGGIEYITTDSWTSKESGKERIKNAVIGLVIVIASWLILYTINPALLTLNLNITPSTVTAPTVVTPGNIATNPCYSSSSQDCLAENAVRKRFDDAHIGVNHVCVSSECLTQVGGLAESTITGVIALKNSCGCNIMINGGNELANRSGSSGHVYGVALDIAANSQLNSYFKVTNPVAGQTYDVSINGKTAKALYEIAGTQAGGSTSTGTHWHVTFP